MSENKKTFWPYGILLALLAIIIACVVTIVVASHHPVYEDDFYFDSYQNVENDYNKIQIAQKLFNRYYFIDLDLNSTQDKKKRMIYSIDYNTNKVRFILRDRLEGMHSIPPTFKIDLLLTRPHTKTQDEKLQTHFSQDPNTERLKSYHRYFIDASLPPLLTKGRWQLKIKLQKQDDTQANNDYPMIGFFSYELNVR